MKLPDRHTIPQPEYYWTIRANGRASKFLDQLGGCGGAQGKAVDFAFLTDQLHQDLAYQCGAKDGLLALEFNPAQYGHPSNQDCYAMGYDDFFFTEGSSIPEDW